MDRTGLLRVISRYAATHPRPSGTIRDLARNPVPVPESVCSYILSLLCDILSHADQWPSVSLGSIQCTRDALF